MPQYRRAKIEGSVFFFTVVLADRSSNLLFEEIERLRQSYRTVQQRLPFETIAICVLPDHLHALWALPESDADFSTRWNLIKSGFREVSMHGHEPRAKLSNVRKASGSGGTGSTQFAMTPILIAMSTTFTSIR